MSDQSIKCNIKEEPIIATINTTDAILARIETHDSVISCVINEDPKITCVINDEPVINVEITEIVGGAPFTGDLLAQYLIYEDLTMQVNGVQTDFITSVNYISGTLKTWVNGIKERTIIELTQNSFRLTPAPDAGDFLDIEYIRNDN